MTEISETGVKIDFHPNPIQGQFITSMKRADLFSCRQGEGKSAALVWSCFHFQRHNPHTDFVFIRDTWENLQRTTLAEFFEWFPIDICGVWNEKKKLWRWLPGMGFQGNVHFLGMDDEKSATKLQSMPFDGFAIDEVAPVLGSGGVSEAVFDIALGRRRSKKAKWVAGKLATNNPDESHWAYRRFVDPGSEDFGIFQTGEPENSKNLADNYYENLAKDWAHRPDFVNRLVKGKYGYIQEGRAVTPEWDDDIHLTEGLEPVKGLQLQLLWDGGLNPTCIITQVTPLGSWNFLEGYGASGIGIQELIEDIVKPALTARYHRHEFLHIGDPTLKNKEQSSSQNSALRVILKELGGRWRPGVQKVGEPDKDQPRIDPLRAVLRRIRDGRGVVQVDRNKCRIVWHALRGGWKYNVPRSGVTGHIIKDEHSHPGDCCGYGASVLFPLGKISAQKRGGKLKTQVASFFKQRGPLGFERPGVKLPKAGVR